MYPRAPKAYTKKKWILFVDDEPELLTIFKDLFAEVEGFSPIVSNNARDAVIKVKNQRFDVICTDYKMPEMSGVEFIKEVRKTHGYEKIPLMVITAHPEEATKECAKIPQVLILSKPVNLESVVKLAQYIAEKGKLPSL